MSINYRPEIDGLRALAVLPVLLFHIGFEHFSGGFVGVDIFFVISGYLITLILLREKSDDNFSIARFYERRARRILPALLAMIFVCLCLSYFWMAPSQLKEFGGSSVSAIFFISNLFFLKHSSYFDAASEEMPLLHTWSLAVEEQYYIVFPIFILLTWRFGFKAVFGLVVLGFCLSLGLSEYGWRNHNTANFFLIPFRAWEILAGSICAFILFSRPQLRSNQALPLLGFAMIVSSIFIYDKHTPFPSVYTLLPVVGTCLIILFCSAQGLVGRVLAFKPIVFIGLISYSAYLWHQPLLAFYRIRFGDDFSIALKCGFLLASFVIAYFSWRFIETPFRRKTQTSTRRSPSVLWSSAIAMTVSASIGVLLFANHGFPDRQSVNKQNMVTLEQQVRNNYGLSPNCQSFNLSDQCKTSNEPEVLLWGDSFAMHLGGALVSANKDIKLIQLTQNSCPPLLDFSVLRPNKKGAENCIAFNRDVMGFIERTPSIKKVVISSQIAYLLDQKAIGNNGQAVVANKDEISQKFLNTASKVSELGREILFVSPTPANGHDLGKCVFRKNMFGGNPEDCSFTRNEFSRDARQAFQVTENIRKHVNTLLLSELICDATNCATSYKGTPIYRDAGHLSYEGAKLIGSRSEHLKAFIN
ncbi:acyltransferase [Leucothrix sargassi]|nr:acyltransferase [Leucothrix sargassi]